MPDDHYCCKICGQRDCKCPSVYPSSVTFEKTLLSKKLTASVGYMVSVRPSTFIRDYRDNSVTWKFSSQIEADNFVAAVEHLMKGI